MIPLFKVFVNPDLSLVNKTLLSGYIGQGPIVDEFEKQLGDYLGNPFVNTVNSGTSALHLALHMLKDSSERTEVLTTPVTCTATNIAILANGLKLKWIDIDPNTCNFCLTDLRRKLSPKTLAIMAVHWGGYPIDLDELKSIQDQCFSLYGHRPMVIEDCAHAFGSKYKGKYLGNHGNLVMYSLQSIKHLTTSDGGLLLSPNKELHERAKLLRWFGLDRTSSADFRCSQNIQEWGYKFQMNDVMASIGVSNMLHIDEIIGKHKRNNLLLRDGLKDVVGLQLLENKEDRESAAWVFTVLVENRDKFIIKMSEAGIMTSRVHDRNDKHKCFEEFKSSLPMTDYVCSKMISLPCGWWVSEDDVNHIINTIRSGW